MKNLGYIAEEISKGNNLADNLEKYSKGISLMYYTLANIKLSMNYYIILDIVREKNIDNPAVLSIFSDVRGLVRSLFGNGGCSSCLNLSAIECTREQIIHMMEIVTEYTDRFRIYEYVLNRVEYKYTGSSPDLKYYNTYMTNDIMHYILSDKDNVAVNAKISEMVGQLPVRMTRGKFYEHIRDAFTLYHGAQKKTIDDFYYALSTSAMLKTTDGFDTIFPEIYDLYESLRDADYGSADFEAYKDLRNTLDTAVCSVTDIADIFVLLAQAVNDLYTIVLSDSMSENVQETAAAARIISSLDEAFDNDADMEEIAGEFSIFEGKQEKILEALSSDFATKYAKDNLADKLEALGLDGRFDNLYKISMLQSGSDFVDLQESPESVEIPDDDYADRMAEELIQNLDQSFKEHRQIIRRAVMASVLSGIPVFFNNTEEIQAYINHSLIQCSDVYEQAAVIEVVKMIISR